VTHLKPGDQAPDFTLPLDDGSAFTLSAQRGQWVVLYFYPQDDSGGCVNENLEFTERADAFASLSARLVGISPDSIETHRRFRAKYDLKVPLAADPQRSAIDAYGLWQLKTLYGRHFMGLIRSSFIIDDRGRIARILRAMRIRGHAQNMLEALQELSGAKD